MRVLPENTGNRNIPRSGVFLIAEETVCSGEQTTTFYADADGNMWKVGNWVMDKPQPALLLDVGRLTGLPGLAIMEAFDAWRSGQGDDN